MRIITTVQIRIGKNINGEGGHVKLKIRDRLSELHF